MRLRHKKQNNNPSRNGKANDLDGRRFVVPAIEPCPIGALARRVDSLLRTHFRALLLWWCSYGAPYMHADTFAQLPVTSNKYPGQVSEGNRCRLHKGAAPELPFAASSAALRQSGLSGGVHQTTRYVEAELGVNSQYRPHNL